jgi:hypothetical protein
MYGDSVPDCPTYTVSVYAVPPRLCLPNEYPYCLQHALTLRSLPFHVFLDTSWSTGQLYVQLEHLCFAYQWKLREEDRAKWQGEDKTINTALISWMQSNILKKLYKPIAVYCLHHCHSHNPVAHPGIFFGGGAQQIQLRTEDRENGDLGAVAP